MYLALWDRWGERYQLLTPDVEKRLWKVPRKFDRRLFQSESFNKCLSLWIHKNFFWLYTRKFGIKVGIWIPNYSLIFKWWLKRGWMPNGLVLKCHLNTRQPKHLNTGQMDTIFFLTYWCGIRMVCQVLLLRTPIQCTYCVTWQIYCIF